MSIHLLKEEEIMWKSYPGKKYRTFLFASQFGIALILSFLVNIIGKQIKLNELFDGKILSFLTIALIVGGLLFALYNQLMLLFIQYFITTDRIIIKKGWLNRKLSSIKHESVRDTKVEQSFAERMISTGHIFIFTSNDTNVKQDDTDFLNNVPCFKNIDDPFIVHGILEQAIEINSRQK